MNEEVDEGRRLNLTISTELHKALRIRTVIEGKSMSSVVEDALTQYLNASEIEVDEDKLRSKVAREYKLEKVKRSENV